MAFLAKTSNHAGGTKQSQYTEAGETKRIWQTEESWRLRPRPLCDSCLEISLLLKPAGTGENQN